MSGTVSFLYYIVLKNNYDNIAWFYDRLSRSIFGNAQINAQLYLLHAIPPHTSIVIVGGGTGWILEEITRIHPSGLTITYIDASSKMMALAKKRNIGENKVTFIVSPVEEVVFDSKYDVALTPFFFDNFKDDSLQKIFAYIDAHLSNKSIWLYCDFQNTGNLWHGAVLKIMYVFFRLSCGIEAAHLPDIESCFIRHHYRSLAQKTFLKGFIVSGIYERG